MRLRVRAALERLADGEDNLSRLAADLDFADHSHLCRVIRNETGSTPSSLRDALRVPAAHEMQADRSQLEPVRGRRQVSHGANRHQRESLRVAVGRADVAC